MATEKTAEGIRSFAKDIIKLEALVLEGLNDVGSASSRP